MKNLKRFLCMAICVAVCNGMTAAFAVDTQNHESTKSETIVAEITPSTTPTETPSETPSTAPTETPSETPSTAPTETPSETPSTAPTETPSETPSTVPTETPVPEATVAPARNLVNVTLNGEPVIFPEAQPYEENGVTYVPMRAALEKIAAVAWRGSDNTVHIFRDNKCVVLTINKETMDVYSFSVGKRFEYTSMPETKPVYESDPTVKARIESDNTLIPIRATCEAFGISVDWDDSTQTVVITDGSNYKIKNSDRDAAGMIEMGFIPNLPAPKTADVTVTIHANFEGASSEVINGVQIKLGDTTQTVSATGAQSSVTFKDVKIGEYEIQVTGLSDSYVIKNENLKIDLSAESTFTVTVVEAEQPAVQDTGAAQTEDAAASDKKAEQTAPDAK